MQEGSHDCGLFSLAYITSICNGQNLAVLLYKQNAMRKHILNSIEDRVMTAFLTSASRLPKASISKNIPVYCICWHINDGSKMIQCDVCQQWFHVACMKINTALHAVQYKLIITICNSHSILIFLLHDTKYWEVVSLMSALYNNMSY